MKAVIQEETTGCAIASSAAIAGLSYQQVKHIANNLGIFAEHTSLWSSDHSIRKILSELGFQTGTLTDFTRWERLPELALLSTNWHLKDNTPYWHWVVFVREDDQPYLLDSKPSLTENKLSNFEKTDVKWFIPVYKKA